MIEHCISSIRRKQENEKYKAYVTDALKAIIEVYHAAHGITIELPRYTEEPVTEPEETAEDIIQRITDKLTKGI